MSDTNTYTKQCTKCGESKQLDDFQICGGRYRPWCKKCHSVYQKEYRLKNRDYIKEKNKEYRDLHKDQIKKRSEEYNNRTKEWRAEKARIYREKNKEKIKEISKYSNIKQRYGLDKDKALDLLQKGCFICGTKEGKLCIDHCHKTDMVRGCLCDTCNKGLGHFKDSAYLLNRAKEYLCKN